MRYRRTVRIAGPAVAALAIGAVAAGAVAQEFRPRDWRMLEDTVYDFVAALTVADDAALGEALCLDRLAGSALARAEALGLVADAADPAAVEAYRNAYLAAVHDTFDDRVESGLAGIDTSGARIAGAAESELPGVSDASLTATGIIELSFVGAAAPVQVPILRLGEAWCMNPVSVQPPQVAGAE